MFVGVPATAAVGCNAAATSNTDASSLSTPCTSLAKCQTFGSAKLKGTESASTCVQNGSRDLTRESTAKACSAVFFEEAASATAIA